MFKNFKKGFAKLMPLSMIAIMVSSLFVFFAVQQSTVQPVFAAVPTFTLSVSQLTGGSNTQIEVTFSEAVSGTSGGSTVLDAADFTVAGTDSLTISSVDHIVSTGVAILNMSGVLTVGGVGEVTIACAATAIYDDGATSACTQGATDVNSATVEAVAPTLGSWALNMNAGTITLPFDENMDFGVDIDETKIVIQDDTGATNSYTLTDSTGAWTVTDTFTITLSTTDLNALKVDTNIGASLATSYIETTASHGFTDAEGTALADITTGDQATTFTVDATDANLSSWQLDMDAETLTMVYDEPVDVSTLLVGQITLQATAASGNTYTLTDSSTASGDGTTIVIDLSATDVLAIKVDTSLAIAQASSWLFMSATTIDDMIGNAVIAIVTGTAQQASSYTADTTVPTVTDGNISIGATSAGTGGAHIIGTIITVTWNNSAGGDNNLDIAGVTANMTGWGGGAAVAMTDTTACGGTNGDDIYEACYTLVAGAIDTTNVNTTVTATDYATNPTSTADTSNSTVDNQLPVVTDANISITGGSGTGGAYIIGDTVTATWDAATDGTTDLASTVTNLSGFGGGAAVAMTDTTACGGTNADSIYEACYTVVAGAIDATSVNVTITATDDASLVTGPVGDTTNATVDNIAPIVTVGNIIADESACTGTGGVCKIGDVITFTWNNTAGGDNNADEATITGDLTSFGGAAAQTLYDDGATGGDTAADDTYTYAYTVVADDDDATNSFTLTVVDNAGNSTGPITSADTAPVDNVAPTIGASGTFVITLDGGSTGVAEIGDTVTYSDGTPGSADSDIWTVDITTLTGDAVATNAGSPYTVIAGALNGAIQFTETVTDNAGNTATGNTIALNCYNVVAGSLTSTDVALSSYWMNGDVAATITFTNTTAIPADGKIAVIFPAGYDVTGINSAISAQVDGTLTVGVAGQTVTITRSGGTQTTATDVTIQLTTVKNPPTAGITGTYTFKTQASGGSTLDEDTAVPGDTIIDPSARTTTTTSGGGGGGGGGGQISSTSNTRTSTIASKVDTITANQRYSRPIQFNNDQITINIDNDTALVQATSETGILTIKPNSKSTINLIIPQNTTVTSDAGWSGRIDPPLIRSLAKIHASGEEIEGSGELLERVNVEVLVEVGDGGALTFSNDVTLTIPVNLPSGRVVNVYSSTNGNIWNAQGTGVVVDGFVVIMTNHLSFYALEMTDETSVVAGMVREAAPLFSDTSGHWAEGYIEKLADMGVVSGKTPTSFSPNDNITRAELTKIALKALNYSINPNVGDTYFNDVSSSAWYAPYVVAAKESGIVKGYDGDRFSPDGNVNRAEALKVLIEAAGFTGVDSNFETNYSNKEGWTYVFFPDVLMDEWFAKYVAYAKDFEIVGGYVDGTFKPGNNITRAEVAKIVMNILDMQ